MVGVLTISLAGIINSGEVLVATALVGTLSVVADMGTDSKLLTLVLICQTPEGPVTHITHSFGAGCSHSSKFCVKNTVRVQKTVPSHLFRPLGWKPGLQEQKESVPFTTQ